MRCGRARAAACSFCLSSCVRCCAFLVFDIRTPLTLDVRLTQAGVLPLPRRFCCPGGYFGTMTPSDSLQAALRPGLRGSLQFPVRLSYLSALLRPGGSSALHLQVLHAFFRLRREGCGSAPPCSGFSRGPLSTQQASLYATDADRLLPLLRAFDATL